jgi:tetratricopeptide (TPR) repeat protein
MSHPGAAAISRLLAPLGGQNLATLSHLLECRLCRVRLRPELAERTAAPAAARPTAPEDDLAAGYDALWERLEESLRERAGGRVREETEGRLGELLALPEAERQQAIETDERFRSWGLAQRLLETGRRAGRADPADALERFNLALALVDRLDPEGAGTGPAAGLVARAHCYLAESLAAAGDLAGAEAAFQHAALHLEASADPLDRAWFCHLLSRMRAEQGRGDEAVALAGRAATLFAGVGQAPEAAAALLDQIRLLLEQL